jgi:hypothetical protein
MNASMSPPGVSISVGGRVRLSVSESPWSVSSSNPWTSSLTKAGDRLRASSARTGTVRWETSKSAVCILAPSISRRLVLCSTKPGITDASAVIGTPL